MRLRNRFIDGSMWAEGRRSGLDALVLEIALFAEDATAHLQNGLKAFTATLGIFAESLHACLLDLVLDLLPAATESGDLGFLGELRRGVGCVRGWLIHDRLADVEDI